MIRWPNEAADLFQSLPQPRRLQLEIVDDASLDAERLAQLRRLVHGGDMSLVAFWIVPLMTGFHRLPLLDAQTITEGETSIRDMLIPTVSSLDPSTFAC